MALTKWSPRSEMTKLFNEFMEEPFFTRFKPGLRKLGESGVLHPSVDMYDKEDEIVVKAEIPGVDKKDVNISLTDNTLTIKGESKKEKEVKEEYYYYSERSHGTFARMLSLPEKVVAEKVTAEFKDGVLEVHLPKSPEAKPKEIKVKVN